MGAVRQPWGVKWPLPPILQRGGERENSVSGSPIVSVPARPADFDEKKFFEILAEDHVSG